MTDRWNEALEAAAKIAFGYYESMQKTKKAHEKFSGAPFDPRAFGIDPDIAAWSGSVGHDILALREADPVHPSAKPFKCPHCGSHCFGPTWRGKELAGRYCKGWPSDEDRSYRQCPAKYVEWYGQADQRGAAGGCVTSGGIATESTDRPVAPHHPGWQEKADGKVAGDAGTTVDSPEAARIPLGMVLVPRDRIEGLLEYWNGNPNERAMWDALTHTQEELHAMLAAAEEEIRRG